VGTCYVGSCVVPITSGGFLWHRPACVWIVFYFCYCFVLFFYWGVWAEGWRRRRVSYCSLILLVFIFWRTYCSQSDCSNFTQNKKSGLSQSLWWKFALHKYCKKAVVNFVNIANHKPVVKNKGLFLLDFFILIFGWECPVFENSRFQRTVCPLCHFFMLVLFALLFFPLLFIVAY